jgi:hypothetical protein
MAQQCSLVFWIQFIDANDLLDCCYWLPFWILMRKLVRMVCLAVQKARYVPSTTCIHVFLVLLEALLSANDMSEAYHVLFYNAPASSVLCPTAAAVLDREELASLRMLPVNCMPLHFGQRFYIGNCPIHGQKSFAWCVTESDCRLYIPPQPASSCESWKRSGATRCHAMQICIQSGLAEKSQ